MSQSDDLQARVAELERKVEWLMQRAYAPLASTAVTADGSGASAEVMDLVRRGNKIGAIKQYRQESGLGLREAKEFVDRLS